MSGSGTNCENLIKYFADDKQIRTAVVISNRSDAYALVRAERLGVPSIVINKAQMNDESYLMPILQKYEVNFIVLAGYLLMIPDYLINAFPRRMINLHPALLPRHGGKGMWGHHVHEAVKAAGDTETGMTVHYVSNVCDGGEIIAQFSTPLTPDDTPETIADKEHVLEMEHFPAVVRKVIEKKPSPLAPPCKGGEWFDSIRINKSGAT